MNPFWLIAVLQGLLLLLLAPLYSGFARVLRAKMHSRTGPPLTQNYRDIAKLMTRQEVVSNQTGWIFRLMPYLSLATMYAGNDRPGFDDGLPARYHWCPHCLMGRVFAAMGGANAPAGAGYFAAQRNRF